MKMNEDGIKGKWLEIKGEVQKAWGKLTDDELEKTKGDMKSVAGLIQQKYAAEKDTYGKKLSDIYSRFEDKKEAVVADAKDKLKS